MAQPMDDFLGRLDRFLLPLPQHPRPQETQAKPLKQAAVLVPIVVREGGPTLLLTRRADHLRSHAGQVSFPGGRIEAQDKAPSDAALREAFEEIGLDKKFVMLKGALPPMETGTGFLVHPVVGLIEPGFLLKIDASEVAEVFEVPLSFLQDPRNHERHYVHFGDRERIYYAIRYDGHTIWGATAGMIVELYQTLYQPAQVIAPSLRFAALPWMTAGPTRRVIAALEANGAPARFVGGCVRNALIERPVKDIDIATPETPDVVVSLLAASGIKAIPTGFAHGTVTAVADGSAFEITTLRRDVATDGRHAIVAYTRDWAEDAKRRDFTINAIYADKEGKLYDYVGGLPDLHTKHVRFIGKAAERIAEDYLRILRFFRFHAWYGQGDLDADGLAACAAAKDGLKRLSAERVAQELTRILEARNPLPIVSAMANAGILAEILPEGAEHHHLRRLLAIETVVARNVDWTLRLSALTGRDPARADVMARRLKLSGDVRERLIALAGNRGTVHAEMSEDEIRAACYWQGLVLFRDLALLSWASGGDEIISPAWSALIAETFQFAPPHFPLTGADVMAAGVSEGPRIGAILRELEEGWVANKFRDDRSALLARLADKVRAVWP